MKFARRTLVPLLLPGILLLADDRSAGVALPKLRATTGKLTVVSALVSLQGTDVAVTWNLDSSSACALTLQTPRFGWLGETEPYPDRQFPELRISVAGAAIQPEITTAAFSGQVDITSALLEAGLDPFLITETPPLIQVATAVADKLEKLGAIKRLDGDYVANWTAQRTLKIPIPAGKTSVTLTYRARPAFELRPVEQIANLSLYCVTPEQLSARLNHPAPGEMFLVSEYTIPISIDEQLPQLVDVRLDEKSISVSCGEKADRDGAVHILSVARRPRVPLRH